jgi:hypothetical protein
VDNTALSAVGLSEPFVKNEQGGFTSPMIVTAKENLGHAKLETTLGYTHSVYRG